MNRALALLCVGGLLGCGRSLPSEEEVEEAKGRVEAAVKAADHVRAALEALGILPVYTCGEPRRTFVGRAAEDLKARASCVVATTEVLSDTSDGAVLRFDEAGCEVGGRTFAGLAIFRYSGGEDRMELEADLEQLTLDGMPLKAKAGYGTCGDERRVWATAQSAVPESPDILFTVDGSVALQAGAPLVGGTTLVLDGNAAATSAAGTDRITFEKLHYEVGSYLPKAGAVILETSKGGRVKASFQEKLWRLGEAELTIDPHDPVTVPIVQ